MSQSGQSRRLSDLGMSASPRLRTYGCDVAKRRFGPLSDIAAQLLDHLVGACQHASGTVTLIALAVLRFITNSNLVGCSTGRSEGLMPWKSLTVSRVRKLSD